MRTAIVIPARLGATRLPNKPLADLGGVPMVVRTLRQAQKVRGADLVVVATDDARIAEAVRSHGGQAAMTRADHASGTDRVAEAAAALGAELVVNVQGDEPFVDPRDIETVFEGLRRPGADMATLKSPLRELAELRDPNVVKVVTRDDDAALYFSRAPIPHDRAGRGELTGAFRHIGVYGYQRAALEVLSRTPPHLLELREGLEQLRAMAKGMRIVVLPARTVSRGIDTEQDLAWARARVEEHGENAFP